MKKDNKNERDGLFKKAAKFEKDQLEGAAKGAAFEVGHILGLDTFKDLKSTLGCFGVIIFVLFWPIIVIWRVFWFLFHLFIF